MGSKKMTINQPLDFSLIIFLSTILICAVMYDFRIQKIPNLLTIPAAFFAIAYNIFFNGLSGFLFSSAGMVAGVLLLIIPYLLGGMGAGDAKLMGVVGAVLGAKGVFYAFLFCAIIGGIYAVTFTLFHRQHFRGFYKKLLTSFVTIFLLRKYIPNPKNSDLKKPRLCYGAAIALGTGIYIVLNQFASSLIG